MYVLKSVSVQIVLQNFSYILRLPCAQTVLPHALSRRVYIAEILKKKTTFNSCSLFGKEPTTTRNVFGLLPLMLMLERAKMFLQLS